MKNRFLVYEVCSILWDRIRLPSFRWWLLLICSVKVEENSIFKEETQHCSEWLVFYKVQAWFHYLEEFQEFCMANYFFNKCLIEWLMCPLYMSYLGFPGGTVVKNPPADPGDVDSIPGWGRPPAGGHGSPLQCSRLENPMDRGAWQAASLGLQRLRHDWVTNTLVVQGQRLRLSMQGF